VTADESQTSEVPGADSAQEELWLTYLNYDSSVQQAVRRLGALSQENVDLFRDLLLKERKRSRFKDYEAESVRRLQGEAFVGDEALQRTLIVLNAEDRRYGEELKRRVAAEGKPEHLDQLVAEIRGTKPVKETAAIVPNEIAPAPVAPAAPVPEPVMEPISEPVPEEVPEHASVPEPEPVAVVPPTKVVEPVREAEIVPIRATPAAASLRPVVREDESKRNLKWPIAIGAVLLIGAAGAVFVLHGKKESNGQAVVAAKLQAAASATEAAEAVTPDKAANPPAAAPAPAPEPAAPSEAAAPEDKTASAQAEPASPPLRPATTQPDAVPAPQAEAPAPQAPADNSAAPAEVSATPVVGSSYKVVRGDMLSDIARKVYGDAHKWRLIQAANPSLRHKPDFILVDQVIFIPPEKQ
jgi:hypothetical protein